MQLLIGEFVGTYLMLALGLGTSVIINYFIFPNGQNRHLTGFYWGLSILIASLLSTWLFNTAEFNPIVSLTQAIDHKVNWFIAIGEIATQILGAWFSSLTVKLIWSKWLRTLPLNLNFYATVPRNIHHWGWNLTCETIGTFLIIINTQIQNSLDIAWWIKTIFSSVLMMVIISIIAPITGAAFNPTRDLIPRLFFSRNYDKNASQWQYAIVPLAGPIIGGVLGILVSWCLF